MNMIDVMKRLAELDETNPNVVKANIVDATPVMFSEGSVKAMAYDLKTMSDEEFQKEYNMSKETARKGLSNKNESVDPLAEMRKLSGMKPLAECGMDVMGSAMPSVPASISVTAANGPELSGMLRDIMSLAGMNQQAAQEPMAAMVEPAIAMIEPEPTSSDSMRSVMDKMNNVDSMDIDSVDVDADANDEEETDEEYDNSPADPRKAPEFDANEFAYKPNQPGQGDRMDGNMPKANPSIKKTMEQIEQSLYADYQSFINESE